MIIPAVNHKNSRRILPSTSIAWIIAAFKTHNSQLPNRRAAASFLRLGPKRPGPDRLSLVGLYLPGRFR